MTTSSLSIRGVASEPRVSARVIHQRRLANQGATAHVISDYVSIFAGVYGGQWIYQLSYAAVAQASPTGVLGMATFVAVLSVFYLHILEARRAEFSPLDILESERAVRNVLCILVTLSAYVWVLHRDATLILFSGTFAVCSFLVQRKLGSLTRSAQALRYALRAAVYGSKYNACSLERWPHGGRSNYVWVGNVLKKLDPELGNAQAGWTILGCRADLECIVAEYDITDVVIAESDVTPSELRDILQDCIRLKLGVSVLADESCAPAYSIEGTSIDGIPGWNYHARRAPDPLSTISKRGFDILLSTILLILLLPVLLLISVLVALDSSGPIFFRHTRIGKDGRAFTIWKFRSMDRNAPAYERSPCSDSDPRLTTLGKILRRYSLDELPQLFNVMKGDMSLVGPRPEMPFIVDQYGPVERLRLDLQPGMTGLWQISPARAMPIHTHMEYDLFYIARQNIFLDIAILFRTCGAVFRGVVPVEEDAQSKTDDISETEVGA